MIQVDKSNLDEDLNGLLDSDADGTGTDLSDTLSYMSSSAGVTVNLATSSASGGDADR